MKSDNSTYRQAAYADAAAHRQKDELKHGESAGGPRRRGPWSCEEEEYAQVLIEGFRRGLLHDCPPGRTYRSYLSHKLQCGGIRISKKFSYESLKKTKYAPNPCATEQDRSDMRVKIQMKEVRFWEYVRGQAAAQARVAELSAHASRSSFQQSLPSMAGPGLLKPNTPWASVARGRTDLHAAAAQRQQDHVDPRLFTSSILNRRSSSADWLSVMDRLSSTPQGGIDGLRTPLMYSSAADYPLPPPAAIGSVGHPGHFILMESNEASPPEHPFKRQRVSDGKDQYYIVPSMDLPGGGYADVHDAHAMPMGLRTLRRKAVLPRLAGDAGMGMHPSERLAAQRAMFAGHVPGPAYGDGLFPMGAGSVLSHAASAGGLPSDFDLPVARDPHVNVMRTTPAMRSAMGYRIFPTDDDAVGRSSDAEVASMLRRFQTHPDTSSGMALKSPREGRLGAVPPGADQTGRPAERASYMIQRAREAGAMRALDIEGPDDLSKSPSAGGVAAGGNGSQERPQASRSDEDAQSTR